MSDDGKAVERDGDVAVGRGVLDFDEQAGDGAGGIGDDALDLADFGAGRVAQLRIFKLPASEAQSKDRLGHVRRLGGHGRGRGCCRPGCRSSSGLTVAAGSESDRGGGG